MEVFEIWFRKQPYKTQKSPTQRDRTLILEVKSS